MFSITSNPSIVISLKNISKNYEIYKSVNYLIADRLNILNFFKKNKKYSTEFKAISNMNLEIAKGERLGIIGRNGAGKTTLLKLITGNFSPTHGELKVNGKVQALMQTGLGFHPELSGRDNIQSSLLYNNLDKESYDCSIKDIIDFCELGDFIDYPVKTYSLGMMSRLQFACATAIAPDILIVDEVLGAGDAYFSGKSAYRMEKLAQSGCTLLLVSHSMQQVLQFCEKAIWIEGGEIVLSSDTLTVVKAYEEYVSNLSQSDGSKQISEKSKIVSKSYRKVLLNSILNNIEATEKTISRWACTKGIKIIDVQTLDKDGIPCSVFCAMDPMTIQFQCAGEESGDYTFRAVLLIFTKDGKILTRHVTDYITQIIDDHKIYIIEFTYDSLMLGNGEYIFSAALYKTLDVKNMSSAEPYDLLSRCFHFHVRSDDMTDPSLITLPGTWSYKEKDKE